MRVYPASKLSRNPWLWRLWAKSFSLQEIGRALGKAPSSICMRRQAAEHSPGDAQNAKSSAMAADRGTVLRLPMRPSGLGPVGRSNASPGYA